MKGKKGLIMGVANERSIAWGISQKLSEAGAELAFTYLGDALKKRVVPLAEKLNSKVTFSCDVEKKEDVIKLFEDIKSSWGEIDFVVHAIAFSDKSELSGEYLNTHGTSTPVGDITELNAVGETFGTEVPKISSTKSLSGHPLGAASVHEAIYSLIMMKNNFITASANISDMDEDAKKFPIVTQTEKNVELNSVMSNSFGFGGTNATLIFEKV